MVLGTNRNGLEFPPGHNVVAGSPPSNLHLFERLSSMVSHTPPEHQAKSIPGVSATVPDIPPGAHQGPYPVPCPNPTCPNVGRLARAKVCYRAQQAEMRALQERLLRYERLGVRRFQ